MRRESEHRAQRRGRTRPVCDQLLHGHAVERKSARRPCPLRAQRPQGLGAGGPGLRIRWTGRGHVPKVGGVGLPIQGGPENGRDTGRSKWDISNPGESYKPIVAEAARKAATEVYNRIMVTHLLMDKQRPNRVAGAVGFNVRTGDFYVFRAKAVIVTAGGASHIFKPRAVGEGMGRTWY